MGTWGVKLYQDDVTSYVKDYYIDRLKRGVNDLELTQEILVEFEDALNDNDEVSLVWFALADIQWNYGRLEPNVKENALKYLEMGDDLTRWEESKDYNKRKKVLEDLKSKLLKEQPKRKRVLGYRLYQCEWNIGDVFALKFESAKSKDVNFFGKYMLFQKVDNTVEHPGHTIPVVRVFNWLGDELPTMEIIYKLPVMPAFFSPVVYAKDYSKKRHMVRKTIMYDMSIGYTAKRYVHKNLIFLGNSLPIRELDRIGDDCRDISWKFLEDELIRTYSSWEKYDVYDVMDGKTSIEDKQN